jgi:hypothetical protein
MRQNIRLNSLTTDNLESPEKFTSLDKLAKAPLKIDNAAKEKKRRETIRPAQRQTSLRLTRSFGGLNARNFHINKSF